MIRGFFFDLDGTLVDTHTANYEAYKHALDQVGYSITYDDFKKTIGMQANDFLPLLAPGIDEATMAKVSEKKKAAYATLAHKTVLNLDLEQFIRDISDVTVTALVTTAKRANAEVILKHHDLTKYFDYIITAEDVMKSKPSPEAYILALKKAGLDAKEVVAFEDSESGRTSAVAAGIPVIMVKEFRI